MKKILTAITIAIFAVSFFGVGSVSAAEVGSKSDCEKLGGSWVASHKKCVADWLVTGESCTGNNGLWQLLYEVGNYDNFKCVLAVDDDGKMKTKKPETYSSADCNILPDSICDAKGNKKLEESSVWRIVEFVLQILTVGVGLVALAGVVYGSALYASAGGNPEQVKKARTIILNVVIGIVAYALMYALLQWLIPGGVFG